MIAMRKIKDMGSRGRQYGITDTAGMEIHNARLSTRNKTYTDLIYKRLQRDGYRYSGPDEICFGMAAGGAIVQMRRGTHRLVSAHFLGLPSVTGYVTHADPDWVAACRGKWRTGPIEAIAAGIGELNAAPPSAKSA